MDTREDWSLRTQEGVLVIKEDKIVERTKSEELDQLLRKYERENKCLMNEKSIETYLKW